MMKRSIFILIILSTISVTSPAQEKSATCPTISVTSPSGVVSPGDIIRFTVQVKPPEKRSDLKYSWSVDIGKISSGQDTDTVAIAFPMTSSSVIASVKVDGLPAGCPDSAAGHYEKPMDPGATRLGEVFGPVYKIEPDLVTRLRDKLREQPRGQLLVVLQRNVENSDDATQVLRRKIMRQLVTQTIDQTRITFVTRIGPAGVVQFWLVPPRTTYT
jgi:hypothetical protein